MTPANLTGLGVSIPPTQDDLPCSDGEPMESQRHVLQMELLIETLLPWLDQRDDGYVGGNMFIYYSLRQVKKQDFRGPDFFAALGVPKGERKSWVCWEEGKTPDVVVEFLSESTAAVDKGEKKDIYAKQMHVPEYFWYDPFNPDDWAGFRLQGDTYEPMPVEGGDRLISHVLNLSLIRWQGSFKGVETTWLRWAELDGTPLLIPEELAMQRAEDERQRAEDEYQRAENERQRANQAEDQVLSIARNLIQTGMPLEQVSQMTGLAIAQLESL